MLIEEIFSSLVFVTEWTFIGFSNVWLLLLVNTSSKFYTIKDYLRIPTFPFDEH